MYIAYTTKQGKEYATLTSSVRDGKKVIKDKSINLGRVLDKERGIYRNRERGVFTYDLETGQYGQAPADFIEPPKRSRGKYGQKKRPLLALQFGDIYFYEHFVRKSGILKALDTIEYTNKDTLHALLCYYVTSSEPNSHAEFWHEVSYAKVLYPKALLASQQINETLAEIGSEENRTRFYQEYIKFITSCKAYNAKESAGTIPDAGDRYGILIDSTIPNCARMPLTAVSSQNGTISSEAKILYVVHQRTGLPLFMRYVPANVIDASTIERTLLELEEFGSIEVKLALLDVGYFNGTNADALYDDKITFVTRAHNSDKVFTETVKAHRKGLEAKENLVLYNGGLYYIKQVNVMLGSKSDRKAYGYLCLDLEMQAMELPHAAAEAEDGNKSTDDVYSRLQEAGLFLLVSSKSVAKEGILSLYYIRKQVEELFCTGKVEEKMLPLDIHHEDTLQGHLIMTLLSTTILRTLQDNLQKTEFSTPEIFSVLRHQVALAYPDSLITSEPVGKMNDIYSHCKIKCPKEIPYTPTEDESSGIHMN